MKNSTFNMKIYLYIVAVLLLVSCSKTINVDNLNGYWEIQEVIMPDGTKKAYNFNDTVDYIEITTDTTGLRKKMKPNLEGTYNTSSDPENFTIKTEDNSVTLHYKTPYSSWQETVNELSSEKLQVTNELGIIYIYKPYEPINIKP